MRVSLQQTLRTNVSGVNFGIRIHSYQESEKGRKLERMCEWKVKEKNVKKEKEKNVKKEKEKNVRERKM